MHFTRRRAVRTASATLTATAALIGASVAAPPGASAATGDPNFCNTHVVSISDSNAQHIRVKANIPYSYGIYSTECKLRSGDRGSGVSALQLSLKKCYKQSIAVDGSFGPATLAALKYAQKKLGLTADGVYGYNTSRAIKFPYLTGTGQLFMCR